MNQFLINENFSIRHKTGTSSMSDFHFHNELEICYSLTDGVNYFINDKVYQVQKGQMFLFKPFDLHKIVISPNVTYERFVIIFTQEFINPLSTKRTDLLEPFNNKSFANIPYLQLDKEQQGKIVNLLFEIEKCANSTEYGSDALTRLLFGQLLIYINSLLLNKNCMIADHNKFEYKCVSEIIEFINNHLEEDISMDQLSSKFYLSKRYLGQIFKQSTGFTVFEYIIHRRIMKARELTSQGLPLVQICEMTGFNDVSHFVRTFKKLTGVSPKKYGKLQ